MIDSVNYIVHNIRRIDFVHLISIGVSDLKSYKRKAPNGKKYKDFRWKYKTVEFKFSPFFNTVSILTTTHKILDPKIDITLSDKEVFEKKVYEIVSEVLARPNIKMELDRIDYYVDVKINNSNMRFLYLRMYEFQMPKLGRAIIKENYVTSIHRSSKRGQYNMSIYSKFEQSSDERYKDVLRIELQMKRAKIKKEAQEGIVRELENYWSSSSMQEYYFEFYRKLFGYGVHMKFEKAKRIINTSNYSEVWKKKLISFLKKRMKFNDWRDVVKTKRTYNSYVDKLMKFNINAQCIPKRFETLVGDADGVENLLDLAYKVAREKYFI